MLAPSILTFTCSLYRKSCSWRLVKEAIGLSAGKKPEAVNSFTYQPSAV